MNKYYALTVAGIIFSLVALLHLLRLINQWEIVISGYVIPMWFSIAGFIITLCLTIWMFVARRS